MTLSLRRCLFPIAIFGWLTQQAYGQTPVAVRHIEISSSASGFRPLGHTYLFIERLGVSYRLDNKTISTDLVTALVAALRAPANPEPSPADLRITPEWLKANAASAAERYKESTISGVPADVAAIESMFADPAAMKPLIERLYKDTHTDDYPSVRVIVTFEDGTQLSASTRSQFPFLLPWRLDPDGKGTVAYNADISRAVAALMPEKSANRDRLAGEYLAATLAGKANFEIYHLKQMLGIEAKTGNTFGLLRTKYSILSAEILQPDISNAGRTSEPTLHLQLQLAHPPNLSEEVSLPYANEQVIGAAEFLAKAQEFEQLVLSVPWIKKYVMENPNDRFRLSYVRGSSLSDQDLDLFSADMHAVGRDKVIAQVKREKARIALLSGPRFSPDWLIFPDGHALLWRYYDFSSMPTLQPIYSREPPTILKWSVIELPTKPCSVSMNYRRCVGREIAATGKLLP